MAKKIARDLFTSGTGKWARRAENLVLRLPGDRDGGGWCERAVVDVIARHLHARAKRAEPKATKAKGKA